MKKDFFTNGKLSGKATVAVICFSLAVVAALGIFSYNRSADELNTELSGINSVTETAQTVPQQTESAAQANTPAEDVPMADADISAQADAEAENVILEHDAFAAETAEQASNQNYGIDGAVINPVSGSITNDYSDGELVKSRTLNVWKTHDGVDIAAELGTDVKSAAAGKITAVNNDPLMGVTVVIDHGSGYEGYYCNLAADVNVTAGDDVSAGTVIGAVGSTAEAEITEEPHLHFGIKKNGSWTDPADILSGEGS